MSDLSRLQKLVVFNGIVLITILLSSYYALFYVSGYVALRTVFVVQIFTAITNVIIWVISMKTWAFSSKAREYIKDQINFFDETVGEVASLKDTLESDDFNDMQEMIRQVNWNEAQDMYSELKKWYSTNNDVDVDKELEDALK